MLDLNDLETGQPAIDPALGRVFALSAGICLEKRGHSPGVMLSIRGHIAGSDALLWPLITQQARLSFDRNEAIERGAMGLAVLLLHQKIGLVPIRRGAIDEGIDYWMGPEGSDSENAQPVARLEISGTLRGGDAEIRRRVREKLAQTAPTDGPTPAYVVVVGFRQPVAEVRRK